MRQEGKKATAGSVRMLCFIPRTMKGTDVFHLEVGWGKGRDMTQSAF